MARLLAGDPAELEEGVVRPYVIDADAGICRVYRVEHTPLGDVRRVSDNEWWIGNLQFRSLKMAQEYLKQSATPPRPGDRLAPGGYRIPAVESVERDGNHIQIRLRNGGVIDMLSD